MFCYGNFGQLPGGQESERFPKRNIVISCVLLDEFPGVGEGASAPNPVERAAVFGVAPTGNARAWDYMSEPLVRMRNTCLETGTDTLEELLAGVKAGYYLQGAMGGQADANAEFMFGVQEAREIRNGKIGKLLREVSISGDAFEVLKSVDGVGSQFEWDMGAGHCGKGQPAKVDGGGPCIRCRVVIGGRHGS